MNVDSVGLRFLGAIDTFKSNKSPLCTRRVSSHLREPKPTLAVDLTVVVACDQDIGGSK